jgi:hypothetical protein
VSGADVVVSARSLEMDMGEYPYKATEAAPGSYVAENVAMGMGGEWRVKVNVTVRGKPTATAFFLVTLKGPK